MGRWVARFCVKPGPGTDVEAGLAWGREPQIATQSILSTVQVREIRELLSEMGLSLGMKLDEKTRRLIR